MSLKIFTYCDVGGCQAHARLLYGSDVTAREQDRPQRLLIDGLWSVPEGWTVGSDGTSVCPEHGTERQSA